LESRRGSLHERRVDGAVVGWRLDRVLVAPSASEPSEVGSTVGSIVAGVGAGVDSVVAAGVDSYVDSGVGAGVAPVAATVVPGVGAGIGSTVPVGVDPGVGAGCGSVVDAWLKLEPRVSLGVKWTFWGSISFRVLAPTLAAVHGRDDV
jgi:hypothetical protein